MRLLVEVYDPDTDEYEQEGSVILPAFATRAQVAGALKIFNLQIDLEYDYMSWFEGIFTCLVYGEEDLPMIRMYDMADKNNQKMFGVYLG
jgi:hypothetical protein